MILIGLWLRIHSLTVSLISGPKGPNRGTTEFSAGRFTFRANSIKRQSGGNSDDGLEEYPGLSGGGGGGGGGLRRR